MNSKIITCFLILLVVLVVPQANAQTESLENPTHKSLQITIDEMGNANVIHQIRNSNEPKVLTFVDGAISNLEIKDTLGRNESVDISEGMKSIPILPNQGELFITYDLDDLLVLKNNMWTLDFRYLETTTFIVPEGIEILYANERPVYLDGKKGFACHGCQMLLEYSIDESKNLEYVNWENEKFAVEMITFTDVSNFEFNQPAKEISFNVNDADQHITAVIPLELLWGPYAVFLDDEKIYFSKYVNNGTHVWVNVKPDTTGKITIVGTTVVPEFPIIAPLAIGFLMIVMLPLVKKINLR